MVDTSSLVSDQGDAHERRLRVAVVAPELFAVPAREGFATAVEFLIQEMCEVMARCADVTVYSISDSSLCDCRVNGVDYQYTRVSILDNVILPFIFRIAGKLTQGGVSYWQSAGYYAAYAARVGWKIGRRKFDIVHLHNIVQFVPWIRLLAPKSRIVFHIHWHGLSKDNEYFGYGVLRTPLAERCLRDVDAVVAVSRYLAEGIRERFPSHAHKLFVVNNGVRISGCEAHGIEGRVTLPSGIRESSDEDIVVAFTGRIVPEKGLHVLLQAMRIVVQQDSRVKLWVVGAGWRPGAILTDYERELQRLGAGLEKNIRYLGWVPHAELPQVLAKADIYAFPSVWEEPCSTALLEALALGLPVVATSTGGTPELITDGDNGLLVPPNDAEAIAAQILRLVADAELRRKIGRRAQQAIIAKHTWEHVVNELLAVYYYILGFGREPSVAALRRDDREHEQRLPSR